MGGSPAPHPGPAAQNPVEQGVTISGGRTWEREGEIEPERHKTRQGAKRRGPGVGVGLPAREWLPVPRSEVRGIAYIGESLGYLTPAHPLEHVAPEVKDRLDTFWGSFYEFFCYSDLQTP